MAQDIFATSPDIDLRKRWALMQLQGASDSSPVKHPLQAVARAMQGAMGGYLGYQAEQADRETGSQMFNNLPGISGSATPSAPATSRPVPLPPQPQAPQPGGSLVSENPSSPYYQKAIAGIESGGKYDALGPVTKTGDRAYGKYQVMGANVGPWTKQHFGQELTPEQFVQNPQAQDAVFNGQFGAYTKQYGPEGAARAWFAGPGNMNNMGAKDQLGTTVGSYAAKFNAGMQPYQVAALGDGVPAAPQTSPAGPQVAQAAPQGQQAQTPARTQLNIPPEVAATIQRLGSDPRTRGQAWQLYLQYAKPVESVSPMSSDERKQWSVPEGVSAGIDRTTGKPVFSQPANSVNVNTAANPVLEGVGKQIVAQRAGAQTAATTTIPAIHEARRALDDGAITGAFAQGRMDIQKIGGLFGLDTSQVSNTETLRASIGTGVLAHIKELGANPSNADRDYIEKVQGGQIALEEKSIRRILDIQEKYARQAIRNFNRDSESLMGAQGGDQAYKSIAPLMKFKEPDEYKTTKKAPATTPPADLKKKYGLD